MQVAIIKYNAGNIYSVDCALKRVGVDAVITDDEEVLKSSDKIIFPGVGEAASTMHYLRQKSLDKLIKSSEAAGIRHLYRNAIDVSAFGGRRCRLSEYI